MYRSHLRSLLCLVVLCSMTSPLAVGQTATLKILADQPGTVVNRNVYGHFAEHLGRCIYEGIWVGEDSSIANTRGIRNDTVEALRELNVPVLRWPGGCFADEYHWMDGIGPREKRPSLINTHWGGVVENNHFGTHEFLDLCEQIGAEPYICGNVGSGTVQEIMNWVEYMTSDADSPMANLRRANGREEPWKIPYFGVGNESWGCGGNMRPEYYADLYRRYNTFVKNYSGNRIYRIACGSNGADYKWTDVLMNRAARNMNGLSLHYYTIPSGDWGNKGSATEFDETVYHQTLKQTLRMDELVRQHSEVMDRHDPDKRVGMVIDEWGIWTNVEPGTNPGFLYQQNSMRDAIIAGLNFHIFHKHADRVTMTNIAQTVNVLQAMILTDKEKLIRTPTFHVFEMFKVHQGGVYLPIDIATPPYTHGGESIPTISASATRSQDGTLYLSIVNTDADEDFSVECTIRGAQWSTVSGRVLTADAVDSHNTFDQPNVVKPTVFDGATIEGEMLKLSMPSKSVVVLELR